MKVLVLGGAGYIGSVVCERLRASGFDVTIFDSFLYEKVRQSDPKKQIVFGDIRNIFDLIPVIAATDIIVHLAGLSNDPVSDLDPSLTWDINAHANKDIAALCKKYGKKIVFASSCSVYGFADSGVFNESSELHPVSLYAKTKVLSESYFTQPGLDSVILRFATAYGYTEKPRFDLVVNTMTASAYFNKQIVVNGGVQWRPLVHIRDIAQAIELVIKKGKTNHRVYNVGSTQQNYSIIELGRKISKVIPGVELVEKHDNPDTRSYKANFDRIASDLGFKPQYSIEDAVQEFVEAFKKSGLTSMDDDSFFRIKYLKNNLGNVEFVKKRAIDW